MDETKDYINTDSEKKIELNEKVDLVEEEKKIDDNLMFEKKSISIFKLYCHICGPLEIFLTILAIIVTIAAGSSNAIQIYLFAGSFNDFSFATEIDIAKIIFGEELFREMFVFVMEVMVEPLIDKQIKKLLVVGAIMFVCNFLMMFLWSYIAMRQIRRLKINYFRIILNQEQVWFDENNASEFATKVQAQLEQIELGLGDRLGQFIMMFTELIAGFVVAFISSWKLALIFLTSFPFIIAGALIMTFTLSKNLIASRKTYEIAGGYAEELLYNIKTVTSFVNFDYEIKRFGELIDKVEAIDKKRALISGISIGIIIFGIFFGYTVTLLYARKLIRDNLNDTNLISDDEYEDLEEQDEIGIGDIQIVILGIIGSITAMGQMAPYLQIIKAAASSSSDYFTLYERKPKIYISEKI